MMKGNLIVFQEFDLLNGFLFSKVFNVSILCFYFFEIYSFGFFKNFFVVDCVELQ